MASANYVAVQITLTSANQNYNVLVEVQKVVANCPATARELAIQSASGNTGIVLIGDAALSATRFGVELVAAGDARVYGSVHQNVQVGTKWVRSATAGQKVNVEIEAA